MNSAVAITGMGMVTAQGIGVEATWAGVVEGRDVLRPWEGDHGISAGHPLLKVNVAQCPRELHRPEDLPPRLWKKLSRTQHLACIAADEALAHAGLPRKLAGWRAGVFVATTVCGMDQNERFYAQYRLSQDRADVDLMRRIQPHEVGELVARRHGSGGEEMPEVCLSTCVGSAMAIAAAMDAIQAGECDVAIAGGAEALCRVVLSGFVSLKVVAADGCRPFDAHRPGITVGEGAGILLLESAAHARERGATPLAWMRGAAMTCDAHHLTAPDPSGRHAAMAIRKALQRANMTPSDIGYINAHGTGTRDNDAMECAALRSVFCEDAIPPVSSTKRCTGHTFGAAGAIEAILCVQALRRGIAPVNAGSAEPDLSLDLPVVRGGPMRRTITAALSTNFAFGGNNTALVISTHEEPSLDHGAGTPIVPRRLGVHGLGLVTDSVEDVRTVDTSERWREAQERARTLDPAAVAQHDVLAQLVIRAAHQALSMGGELEAGRAKSGERLGLLFVSSWGTIDSTVSYLESMLEAEGRYASPRHFSRSVYSSVAAAAAIHFGIHGPCETLCFPRKPVEAAINRTCRTLAAGRCAKLLVVWAEQAAPIAADLSRLAAEKLGRREYARYAKGTLGFGAAAMLLGANGIVDSSQSASRDKHVYAGAPFPMDAAAEFVVGLLRT